MQNYGYACPQVNALAGVSIEPFPLFSLHLQKLSLISFSRPQAVPGALGRLVEGGFELIQSLPFISASLGGNQSEDCLTINVQRPANIKAGVKLPVMFWVSSHSFSPLRLVDEKLIFDATDLRRSVQHGIELIIRRNVSHRSLGRSRSAHHLRHRQSSHQLFRILAWEGSRC